jgi:hypothetical protein
MIIHHWIHALHEEATMLNYQFILYKMITIFAKRVLLSLIAYLAYYSKFQSADFSTVVNDIWPDGSVEVGQVTWHTESALTTTLLSETHKPRSKFEACDRMHSKNERICRLTGCNKLSVQTFGRSAADDTTRYQKTANSGLFSVECVLLRARKAFNVSLVKFSNPWFLAVGLPDDKVCRGVFSFWADSTAMTWWLVGVLRPVIYQSL